MVTVMTVGRTLGGILRPLQRTARFLGALPFAVPVFIIWVWSFNFLLWNADATYGENANMWRGILTGYMASAALILIFVARKKNSFFSMSLGSFLLTFLIFSAIGAALFAGLQPFEPGRAVLTTESVGVLLTHAIVVAIVEEIIFRAGASVIPIHPMLAQLIGAVAFSIMHWSVYGGDGVALLRAFVLGIVFGAITVFDKRRGLVIAMALHFTWNAAALGFVFD